MKVNKFILCIIGSAFLLSNGRVNGDSLDNKKIEEKSADGLGRFLLYRFPYSVSVKLGLLSDYIKDEHRDAKSLMITQELVADFCYLYSLAELEGGERAKEVLMKLAVGFRADFIDPRGYFNEGANLELISLFDLQQKWVVQPAVLLKKVEVPDAKEKEFIEWYERNWKNAK